MCATVCTPGDFWIHPAGQQQYASTCGWLAGTKQQMQHEQPSSTRLMRLTCAAANSHSTHSMRRSSRTLPACAAAAPLVTAPHTRHKSETVNEAQLTA